MRTIVSESAPSRDEHPAITISMPPELWDSSGWRWTRMEKESCGAPAALQVEVETMHDIQIVGDELEQRLANKIRATEELMADQFKEETSALVYGRDFPCAGPKGDILESRRSDVKGPSGSSDGSRNDLRVLVNNLDGLDHDGQDSFRRVSSDGQDPFRRVKSCEDQTGPQHAPSCTDQRSHSKSLGTFSSLRSPDHMHRSRRLLYRPRKNVQPRACSPPNVRPHNLERSSVEDLESGFQTDKPLRVLTLHGISSNPAVSALQIENLRLHGCDLVPAPAPISVQPDPSVEMFVEGPFFSWFDRDADNLREQLQTALSAMLDFVRARGPFDCAYGFSQGAAMLTLLLQEDVRRLVSPMHIDLKFEFVILGCSSGVSRLREALGLVASPPKRLDIPSLHVIGQKDPLRPVAEAVALEMYATGDQRQALYTAGAHEITRDVKVDAVFGARMTWHLSRFSRAFSGALAAGFLSELGSDGGIIMCESAGELVRPAHELVIPWMDISDFSSIRLVPDCQLVRCRIRDTARGHAETLQGLLAAQSPDKPFLRDARQPGYATTYGELLEFVSPGGDGYLRNQGIRKGEVVVYCIQGGSALGAVAFVAFASQTTCAPLDPNITEKDAAAALDQLEARHVVLFDEVPCEGLAAAAAAAAASNRVQVHSAALWGMEHPGLFRFIGKASASQEIDAMKPEDVALLLRTSGTTATPKGVPLRQGHLVRNGLLLAGTLRLTEHDVALNVMPLFHIGGISASILGTMAVGAQVTCMNAFEPSLFLSALAGEAYGNKRDAVNPAQDGPRPTWYSAVPTIHVAVVNYLQSATIDNYKNVGKDKSSIPPNNLRFIRSGAAALSPQDAQNLSDAFGGLPIWSTYSMSEQMPITQPPAFVDPKVHMFEKEGSVGVPVAASLAIVDPQTYVPQPTGRPGVIAISGPTVMPAYLNNPAADASSFFILSCASGEVEEDLIEGNRSWQEGRFFLTGDVGELDSDGHLTIKGRAKEMIKRGGEQVSPYQVEEVLETHQHVRKAIVFAVPSTTWGEEVGAAIVLEDDKLTVESDEESMIRELRQLCIAQGLAPYKAPQFLKIVRDEDLPKTSTHKYIRSNLAEVLGVREESVAPPRLGPPRVSRALSGIRFLLACQVMFNHIGASSDGGFGLPGFGVVGNARAFCIHMPAFFALAGFGLAQSMGPAPSSKSAFVVARISPMHPIYLLSLLLLLVNFLVRCNPSTYDPTFHWQAQPSDNTRGDFCEPSALLPSYWGTLASTVAVYSLGLQAWFPLYDATWFLSYYAWFSSCYYFLLALYPWLYSKILHLRGCTRKLLVLMVFATLLNYVVVAGFFGGYSYLSSAGLTDQDASARGETYRLANRYCLAYYLSPVGWAPLFTMGVVAAFLFDATRPYLYPNAYLWGILCDIITAGLVAQSFVTARQPQDIRPSSIAPEDGLSIRAWAAILSRIYGPLMVLWLFAMAVGKGLTCRVFSSPYFVDTLGPISYFTYLFHQVVSEWYWLATRGEWWSWWRHRKDFYWFSPAPCPVAWWEFFFVVTLTVWFSMVLARIDPWLVAQWERAKRGLRVMCGGAEPPAESSTLALVLSTVSGMTGVAVDPESTLAEVGLASIAAPVLISQLSRALPHVTVSVADLVAANSVGDLAELLEERRLEATKSGI